MEKYQYNNGFISNPMINIQSDISILESKIKYVLDVMDNVDIKSYILAQDPKNVIYIKNASHDQWVNTLKYYKNDRNAISELLPYIPSDEKCMLDIMAYSRPNELFEKYRVEEIIDRIEFKDIIDLLNHDNIRLILNSSESIPEGKFLYIVEMIIDRYPKEIENVNIYDSKLIHNYLFNNRFRLVDSFVTYLNNMYDSNKYSNYIINLIIDDILNMEYRKEYEMLYSNRVSKFSCKFPASSWDAQLKLSGTHNEKYNTDKYFIALFVIYFLYTKEDRNDIIISIFSSLPKPKILDIIVRYLNDVYDADIQYVSFLLNELVLKFISESSNENLIIYTQNIIDKYDLYEYIKYDNILKYPKKSIDKNIFVEYLDYFPSPLKEYVHSPISRSIIHIKRWFKKKFKFM